MAIWPFRKNAVAAEFTASGREGLPSSPGSLWRFLRQMPAPLRLFAILAALLLLWFGVLGGIRGGISADVALRPTAQQLPVGGSVTIGYAARIIDNNINEQAFTPNDPAFYPTGMARHSKAFQRGVMETVATTIGAIAGEISEPQLTEAAQHLATPADRWWFQAGWPPIVTPAERRYAEALASLIAYNNGLASTPEVAETSSPRDRLQPAGRAAVGALVGLVDAAAIRGDRVMRGMESGSLSEYFSGARGTAYAAALLLRGIRDDNSAAIRLSGNAARWGEALDALERAAQADPLIVRTSNLVDIGYSLLLAGNAMRDILEARQ